MYNEKSPVEDCGYPEQATQSIGYAERILQEIHELQALSERIQSKTFEISGSCVESAHGDGAGKVVQEPQNFCEHTLKDLARVRRVLVDALDNLGSL
jgi:hypothetical protein